ncbi:MutS protein msh4 [Diplodia seriata]|uniref:MutS protein msh4 n=1 Tax=Diplodia seriata TaxID=420778 RepID=A0ABR3C2D9_9PEZI
MATHASATFTATSRSRTGQRAPRRPATGRPTTAATSGAGIGAQHVVCAVSESRGISPTVGLAIVNLDAVQAVLCQISDSQTYVRTIHKLQVYAPSEILIVSTAAHPKSKLFSIIEENLQDIDSRVTLVDRRYWAETAGTEYIQQLAFADNVEAIKLSLEGNYFCVCCFAAVMKYVELGHGVTFPPHSLRIKYEPSEGSMMMDMPSIRALELIQNLENPKSRHCLFGLLNETLTPMGARLLRSNILQPLTNEDTLKNRYDALEEMSSKEDLFFALILVPTKPSVQTMEQAINHVIMLKQFVISIRPIYEALTGARSAMLCEIQAFCHPDLIDPVQGLIDSVINEDTVFAKRPLDLRNQHTHAVKAGVSGLLDVARQAYREATEDVLTIKFDPARQFYIQLSAADLEDRVLPPVFTNVHKKRGTIECQTIDLMKRNQKIVDAHNEVVCLSNRSIQDLIVEIRGYVATLYRVGESIAMLDMISAFAHLVTSQEYTRPALTSTLAIKAGRHPIRESMQPSKFVPNDFYATQQKRFQVITGCNMSGKSTYIRAVALMAVMTQIGMFVPAQYASMPIRRQLFARVSLDDSIEANVSTFAAEMREAAFILRNISKDSIAIIDELGRGTSTRDGLAIALAIAEALVDSRAFIWFATHFRELAKIMGERSGVVNLHLAVDTKVEDGMMNMLYKIAEGPVGEQHYGLALARVVPLPSKVLERAGEVSTKLKQRLQSQETASATVVRERRRRLLLTLKEHLVQAQSGAMEGRTLGNWLKELQREFVIRMSAIDAAATEAEVVAGSEDEHVDESGPIASCKDTPVATGHKACTGKDPDDTIAISSGHSSTTAGSE